MTEDTMRRAFEPFLTTRTMGLGGLGLPMVRRFVQEAGGRVGIESESGVGMIVTLRLPVPAPQAEHRSVPSQLLTSE